MNGLRIHNRCTCSIDVVNAKRLENPLLIRSCLVPDLPQYSTKVVFHTGRAIEKNSSCHTIHFGTRVDSVGRVTAVANDAEHRISTGVGILHKR